MVASLKIGVAVFGPVCRGCGRDARKVPVLVSRCVPSPSQRRKSFRAWAKQRENSQTLKKLQGFYHAKRRIQRVFFHARTARAKRRLPPCPTIHAPIFQTKGEIAAPGAKTPRTATEPKNPAHPSARPCPRHPSVLISGRNGTDDIAQIIRQTEVSCFPLSIPLTFTWTAPWRNWAGTKALP